jgi:Ca-activated chloride channel family protein
MFDFLSTWFAYPALLGLLTLLPTLAFLMLRAGRRRRRALALLGQNHALQKLQLPQPGRRRGRSLCLFAGLSLLIVGAAGPRWGRIRGPMARGPERSLVLVLDVSRSMLAEQPSRQDLARRALQSLARTLSEHGGPRVALVIFAAHPQLVFPLTGDYDHLADAVGRIDADDLPPSLRPRSDDGSVSGTRIGEALRLALHVLDPGTGGDILLLSDGDDPAGDDEWLEGAEEARRRRVPVHTIGIGNPREDAAVPFGSGVLEFGGVPVKTRLVERPLQEIARRTRGAYVPAHTSQLPLGKLLPSILAQERRNGPDDLEEALPILQPRYAWFLAPALVLLVLTLLLGERRAQVRLGLFRAAFVPVVALLISAAPLPQADQWLRKGNEAFERGETEEALKYFEDAEDLTADPALVAFNTAAALYRLERYAEAALHYQRCLEDETIPAGRRALAYFQMGNALLQESKGARRDLLEKALEAYRACLPLEETAGALRSDVRHNLELARLLWLKTVPNPEDPPRNAEPNPENKSPKSKNATGKDEPKAGKADGNTKEPGTGDPADPSKGGAKNKSLNAQSGPLTVLPDRSELVPLSPQETEAHLENIAQRILQERRNYRRHTVTLPENVKDW